MQDWAVISVVGDLLGTAEKGRDELCHGRLSVDRFVMTTDHRRVDLGLFFGYRMSSRTARLTYNGHVAGMLRGELMVTLVNDILEQIWCRNSSAKSETDSQREEKSDGRGESAGEHILAITGRNGKRRLLGGR